jgi:hypothetical protein
MARDESRIYIDQLARAINRRPSTIRAWCRHGQLPEHLRPHRADSESGLGWRWWTLEQVAGIKVWMIEQNMLPGSGLRNFDPTSEQAEALLKKLRKRAA